ncbi:Nitrogen assimilation regulatory protein [Anatilimnocola aggregata]|uniref:DNA-binding transcriptional regulator NtrC n=1 Tax=Anatilimnocola aggregata TaxID=2528021 RepID=A0A517YJP3_9BACT|nr:sigma-54 dependent transcriptional regulator [Anatilimnocola aggregata]QDU30443.1 Nitrogen assimilation regulatory protein [Anatilimnocola aggregata]
MAGILIVDDEQAISWGLAELSRQLGHEPHTASSAEQAISLAAKTDVAVILLDVRLPGMDGIAAISRLRELLPAAKIIVMTAHGDLSTAVEAVRQGAFDYIVKPFDTTQIERLIERALTQIAVVPVDAVPSLSSASNPLIGKTPVMQEIFKRIALVSASEACVFISGESGTGKELVARAIHQYSKRASAPFVAVNVAALSPSLAESELFGHVRGAFTGAEQSRAGLLADADGGTLFLDEVADIPLPVQVKLLRALEHGEVMPVGSGRTTRTNFRLISATHQDLLAKVREGTFRHDLYFRLCTFQVPLPPLRERKEDLPLLVNHFLQQLAPGKSPGSFTSVALAEAQRRPWHGNVRELRNAVEHALIVAREGPILPEHWPPAMQPIQAPDPNSESLEGRLKKLVREWAEGKLQSDADMKTLYDEMLQQVEPPLLAAALERSKGECLAASRWLGMHRTTLRKKLDQYGLHGEE